jgi:hypothetical protein
MNKKFVLLIWIFIAIIVLSLFIYDRDRRGQRINKSEFVRGIITGKSKVAKGEKYVDYQFEVGGEIYSGSVSVKFCNECNNECCSIGSIVTVRYERANPSNNDLVH